MNVQRIVLEYSYIQDQNVALQMNLDDMKSKFDALQFKNEELSHHNVELKTLLVKQKEHTDEKIQLIQQLELKLHETFKAITHDALQANNQSFLLLANTTFEKLHQTSKQDLELRQHAISDMLKPVNHTLTQVDQKIQELEKNRVGAYESIKQQILDLSLSNKELKLETTNLIKALRTPNVRGQWGEMQLRRVVEMAGMLPHCDFIEQATITGTDSIIRPDMIIHVPGNKKIIVDAKAPLTAYLEAIEAKSESERNQFLQNHARQVRQHIKQLSQRAYWEQFDETPDFVILFLPGETFFSTALEADPTLIEIGMREKVIMATPTTLIAMLKAVSYGWRQENIAKNAQDIQNLGKEMTKRLNDMIQHLSRVGKSLSSAVDSYNQTIGTFEKRVLVSARKFHQLGSTDEVVQDTQTIDDQTRLIHQL